LGESTTGSDELMSSASQLLSQLSHQIGIVVTPSLRDIELRSVSFVPLSGRKVLCVVVSSSGHVDNKLIETSTRMDSDELQRISNYLTETFAGLTVRKTRDRLIKMMGEERARIDRLMANAIDLARNALAGGGDRDLFVEGTSSILGIPELSDVGRIQKLLDAFADSASLVQLLNQLMSGGGVRVLIGEDSDLTAELDFSLVGTSYRVGGRPVGTLAVFGPTRMPYQRLIPLVNYFGERLSQALETTYAEPS
jgi:heat-inducible transcriptional repressor